MNGLFGCGGVCVNVWFPMTWGCRPQECAPVALLG